MFVLHSYPSFIPRPISPLYPILLTPPLPPTALPRLSDWEGCLGGGSHVGWGYCHTDNWWAFHRRGQCLWSMINSVWFQKHTTLVNPKGGQSSHTSSTGINTLDLTLRIVPLYITTARVNVTPFAIPSKKNRQYKLYTNLAAWPL